MNHLAALGSGLEFPATLWGFVPSRSSVARSAQHVMQYVYNQLPTLRSQLEQEKAESGSEESVLLDKISQLIEQRTDLFQRVVALQDQMLTVAPDQNGESVPLFRSLLTQCDEINNQIREVNRKISNLDTTPLIEQRTDLIQRVVALQDQMSTAPPDQNGEGVILRSLLTQCGEINNEIREVNRKINRILI